MIWGIVLYYLWIVVGLFLSYIILFCCYEDEEYKKKVKFPVYVYILAFVAAFVPILNFFWVGIEIFIITAISKSDAHIKNFLFKRY